MSAIRVPITVYHSSRRCVEAPADDSRALRRVALIDHSTGVYNRRRAMKELTGQTVWITGASSGIGEALAVECFRRHARIIVSARDGERLDRLRRRLLGSTTGAQGETAGGREPNRIPREGISAVEASVLVRPLDLTRTDEIAQAVEQVRKEVGRVDMLIHVAGVSQRALGMETDMAVVRRIMETNFFGPVALTRELLPSMMEGGRARVVVVTSAFGKFGAPGRSSYAASKQALHGYFDSLRTELLPEQVGITLIVPGAVATNISANALRADGSSFGEMDEGIARGLSPEQCARQVMRGVLAGRDEVVVGSGIRLRFALLLKMIAPRLLTRILRTARIT